MNERMDERYGLDTPQEREREVMGLRKKYEALEKDRDSWKSTVESIALMAGMVASETWGVLDILTHVREMRKENADLKAKVERIRHPMVYEGATFYTQAAVPDICPDCDGRNFVSHGVRGMVCWTCCLMRDLEAVQAQVARLSAPVSDAEPDACEGCDKPLREDEGHETEDMVMLCDECWQELLDDLGWHSEECPCDTCIASRTTKEPK